MISGPDDLTELAQVDAGRKRIYLVFEGFLTPDAAQHLKEAYQRAIAEVGPGYTVLSYFKDFTPGTEVIEDVFSSMITMATEAGCRKAARVSSRSVLGPLQMSRLAKVRSGYPSRQFDSWEQAEAYLDGDADWSHPIAARPTLGPLQDLKYATRRVGRTWIPALRNASRRTPPGPEGSNG